MVEEKERMRQKMTDVMIAMAVGVLIGVFGVVAWALSAARKDREKKTLEGKWKEKERANQETEVPEDEP